MGLICAALHTAARRRACSICIYIPCACSLRRSLPAYRRVVVTVYYVRHVRRRYILGTAEAMAVASAWTRLRGVKYSRQHRHYAKYNEQGALWLLNEQHTPRMQLYHCLPKESFVSGCNWKYEAWRLTERHYTALHFSCLDDKVARMKELGLWAPTLTQCQTAFMRPSTALMSDAPSAMGHYDDVHTTSEGAAARRLAEATMLPDLLSPYQLQPAERLATPPHVRSALSNSLHQVHYGFRGLPSCEGCHGRRRCESRSVALPSFLPAKRGVSRALGRPITFADGARENFGYGPLPRELLEGPVAAEGEDRQRALLPLGAAGRRCNGLGATRQARLRLLIGVIVGPYEVERREAIRSTWKRWAHSVDGVLVCFVIGLAGLPPGQEAALRTESRAHHHDLMLLPHAPDGCVLSLRKMWEWWRAAARMRIGTWTTKVRNGDGEGNKTRASGRDSRNNGGNGHGGDGHGDHGDDVYVAKVDDDSFIHVPNLLRMLPRRHCAGALHLGNIAWAGYHPMRRVLCGFSWRGRGKYDKYGCARAGAHPPFPFSLGGLQVLSLSAVQALASSERIAAFIEGHEAIDALTAKQRAESLAYAPKNSSAANISTAPTAPTPTYKPTDDVVLGYWLQDLQRSGVSKIRHVDLKRRMHDISCLQHNSFRREPQQENIMMHSAKTPIMMRYIWNILGRGLAHDKQVCQNVSDFKPDGMTISRVKPEQVEDCLQRVEALHQGLKPKPTRWKIDEPA